MDDCETCEGTGDCPDCAEGFDDECLSCGGNGVCNECGGTGYA
jgi:hypothetical protein